MRKRFDIREVENYLLSASPGRKDGLRVSEVWDGDSGVYLWFGMSRTLICSGNVRRQRTVSMEWK